MIFRRKYSNVLIVTLWVLAGMNCALGMQNPVGEKNEQNEKIEKKAKKDYLQLLADEVFNHLDKNFFSSEAKKNTVGEKLAAIFDIDDTVLDCEIAGYKKVEVPLEDGSACFRFRKAVPQILKFYKKLLEHDVAIFFISCRPEKSCKFCKTKNIEDLTSGNLKEVGFEKFEHIYCMPFDTHKEMHSQKNIERVVGFASGWKSRIRKKIAKLGYKIIVTADDAWQNLCGDNLGYHMLMPPLHMLEL